MRCVAAGAASQDRTSANKADHAGCRRCEEREADRERGAGTSQGPELDMDEVGGAFVGEGDERWGSCEAFRGSFFLTVAFDQQ